MTAHIPLQAGSVKDKLLDLILAAEVLAETREEDGRTAEAWERRIATNSANHFQMKDRRS